MFSISSQKFCKNIQYKKSSQKLEQLHPRKFMFSVQCNKFKIRYKIMKKSRETIFFYDFKNVKNKKINR